MNMDNKNHQHTIRTSIQMYDKQAGSRATLRPAPAGTGIVFRRVDCTPVAEIHAHWRNARLCRDKVTLVEQGAHVSDAGLLLATCRGLGIDNLMVDIEGEAMPLASGRASAYVFVLQAAGIQVQKAPRQFRCLESALSTRLATAWLRITPASELRIIQPAMRMGSGAGHFLCIDRARFTSDICHTSEQDLENGSYPLDAEKHWLNRRALQVMSVLALIPGTFLANIAIYRSFLLADWQNLLSELDLTAVDWSAGDGIPSSDKQLKQEKTLAQ